MEASAGKAGVEDVMQGHAIPLDPQAEPWVLDNSALQSGLSEDKGICVPIQAELQFHTW